MGEGVADLGRVGGALVTVLVGVRSDIVNGTWFGCAGGFVIGGGEV